mmetsp:Transcript_19493/g.64601  ORF Transcript_19493/g.64601 Transcript_19493/m.64601 type:complete len:84 (-) Transcript_19493:2127-2378(-)
MAFTSRSERSPTFAKFGNTPVSVGPGSYGSYFNHVSICFVPVWHQSVHATCSQFSGFKQEHISFMCFSEFHMHTASLKYQRDD